MTKGGACCGIDLDETCSYSTPRFVKIKDRRLGIMNTVFKFFIFVYVVVYNVVIQQGYKVQGDVVGTARLQPRAPDLKYEKNSSWHRFCLYGDLTNRSYTSADGKIKDLPAFECRYLDTFDSVFPPIEAEALFLSTRVNDTVQTLPDGCDNLPVPDCRYDTSNVTTYFIPGTELVTLLLDHTMSVPSLNFSKSSLDMTGFIMSQDGGTVNPCDAYTRRGYACPDGDISSFLIAFGRQNSPDIIALDTLLEAAGISSLDNQAGSQGKFSEETFRYAGIVMVVTINYDNYFSYNEDAVQYVATVKIVRNADFKAEEVAPNPGIDIKSRRIIDRHGVRIVVAQGGRVGRAAIGQLLIVLVTSLGLLAVSSSIVDGVAMNVLKMKHIYRQYRTVTSVDFSDIATIKQSDLKRFEAEDLINPRPTVFAQVGSGGGGVTSGEGHTRQIAKNFKAAPQAGHFADIAVAQSPKDDLDDDETGTLNPITAPPPDRVVQWGSQPRR